MTKKKINVRPKTDDRHVPPVIVPLVALLLWQNIVSGCASIPDKNVYVTTTNQAVHEDFDEFDDEFGDDFDIVDEPRQRDPLGGYNRFMFKVNDKIYCWVLRPVAKVYGKILPEQVRLSIQRCAKNLVFPARFVNSGLQGKFKGAGIELARFGINSTVGIAGLFDPAYSFFDLKPSEEDFGQTLGRYRVGGGWPLVLPLLGQTNLRDAIAMIPDYFLHPFSYKCIIDSTELAAGIRCYEKENYLSLHIEKYDALKKDAIDPYTLIRDAYRQKREADIKE